MNKQNNQNKNKIISNLKKADTNTETLKVEKPKLKNIKSKLNTSKKIETLNVVEVKISNTKNNYLKTEYAKRNHLKTKNSQDDALKVEAQSNPLKNAKAQSEHIKINEKIQRKSLSNKKRIQNRPLKDKDTKKNENKLEKTEKSDLEELTKLKNKQTSLNNLSISLNNLNKALNKYGYFLNNSSNQSNLSNSNNSDTSNKALNNSGNSGNSGKNLNISDKTSDLCYINLLNAVSPKLNLMQMSEKFPLVLAFIGDAVHTLFVRSYFMQSSAGTPETQHNLSSNFCRAKSQSEALDYLYDFLSEQERDLAKRTRNAKNHSSSKNTSPEDYKKATAFEAIIGYLYLTNQIERLQNLLLKFMEKK